MSKNVLRNFIYDYIYTPIYFGLVYFRDLKKIEKYYRGFEKLNKPEIKEKTFVYSPKKRTVCGELMAEISKIIDDLNIKPKNVLLDGDNKSTIKQFKKRFGLNTSKVLTIGIGNNFDYDWNFENDPPKDLPNDFDLVVSQAMLEHLINPYKTLL